MDIKKIKGINTHFRDILEFRYEDTLVRINSKYTSFLLYNWIEIRKNKFLVNQLMKLMFKDIS